MPQAEQMSSDTWPLEMPGRRMPLLGAGNQSCCCAEYPCSRDWNNDWWKINSRFVTSEVIFHDTKCYDTHGILTWNYLKC